MVDQLDPIFQRHGIQVTKFNCATVATVRSNRAKSSRWRYLDRTFPSAFSTREHNSTILKRSGVTGSHIVILILYGGRTLN